MSAHGTLGHFRFHLPHLMPRATVGPMHVRFAMRWHLAVRVHFDVEAAGLSRE
jgi:hypothetical protein